MRPLAAYRTAYQLCRTAPSPLQAVHTVPCLPFFPFKNQRLVFPAYMDLISIFFSGQHAAAHDGGGAAAGAFDGSLLSSAARAVHAAAMLVIPVAGVHACMLVALFWQLPPLVHVAVQTVSVASLMARAPTGGWRNARGPRLAGRQAGNAGLWRFQHAACGGFVRSRGAACAPLLALQSASSLWGCTP